MDLKMNGVNPNLSRADPLKEMKTEQIENEIAAERKKVQRQTEERDEKESQEKIKEQYVPTKFIMSESDMKELLLMMGSRGDSRTIEKLVELVKKEKEMLARQK